MLELIGRIRMDSAQAEGAIGRVTRGTDGLNISSRKAESAVKNFASVIRSGQDPVEALADSVANLTRAFGMGIGATVAIVGVVEVIKSFISESQKLNTVADKLNSTITSLGNSSDNLDFESSIKKVKALTAALKESREQEAGGGGGILGKAGRTIADLLGLSEYRLRIAQDLAENEIATARAAAGIALDKKIELASAEKISKFAAERIKIEQKYAQITKEYQEAGVLVENEKKINILKNMELQNIASAEAEEQARKKAKIEEENNKAAQEKLRLIEEEKKKQEELNLRRQQGLKEYRAGILQIQENQRASAGPLLDRIISAAKNLGIRGIEPLITQRRKETQKILDEEVLARIGISGRDVFLAKAGFLPSGTQEGLRQLVNMEADRKGLEDARLFEAVYSVNGKVGELLNIISERLGVPILRTAY